MKKLYFLTLEELLKIHDDQISNYGGLPGVLSMGLLESAIAQPKSQFHGDYLHRTIPEMAAAYSYHLCLNHAFYDGNKRTALVSTVLFLRLNRCEFICDIFETEKLILDIAKKKMTKSKTAQFIKDAKKTPSKSLIWAGMNWRQAIKSGLGFARLMAK